MHVEALPLKYTPILYLYVAVHKLDVDVGHVGDFKVEWTEGRRHILVLSVSELPGGRSASDLLVSVKVVSDSGRDRALLRFSFTHGRCILVCGIFK